MNKHPEYLLNKISGPQDLKKLSIFRKASNCSQRNDVDG